MNQKKNPPLVKIGAVWERVGDDGKEFLSGLINETVTIPAGTGLLILPNAYKNEGKRRPDFYVLMSDPTWKETETETETDAVRKVVKF